MAKRRRRGEYGKGSVFKRKDRDTWSLQVREADGVRRLESGFATEKAAHDRLAIILGDAAAGKTVPKGSTKLATLAETWLKAREADPGRTSAYDDRKRWELHLLPIVGHMKPSQVTTTTIKNIITKLKGKGLSAGTCKLVIALLSSLYSDIIEDGHATSNPAKSLAKKTRQQLQSTHDPKNTPYLHEMDDVVRVYHALRAKSESVGVAFALGALAGLRTGEVRALDWSHVDQEANTIHVQVQAGVNGPRRLKDRETRFVPIQPSLADILVKLEAREGLVCPPIRGGSRLFLDDHTMGKFIREVTDALGLAMSCSCCKTRAAWYEYTRHGYGCHFILAGGSMEDLSRTMGHSTIAVTEKHYVHLRPDYYPLKSRNLLTADFSAVADSQSDAESSGLAVKLAVKGSAKGVKRRDKAA
jgi:integrase